MDAVSLKCPKCGQADLVTTERNEIEIDVCPSCRGVWLDRGELDKIIERSLAPRGYGASGREWDDGDDDSPRRGDPGRDRRDRPREKRSWLSDLLD